jgi:hypothetical protein
MLDTYMTLQDFMHLAQSYSLTGTNRLSTARQFAEFVLLAKQCAARQKTAEAKQWVAELASGATAYATELCDDDPSLDAVHVALLGLEVEYDAENIRSEWAQIADWLMPYLPTTKGRI